MVVLAQWNGGALPEVVGGSITTATEGPRPPALRVAQTAGQTAYARFDVEQTTTAGHRFYFKTPPAWPSGTAIIYQSMLNAGTIRFRVNMAGTGQAGRIRFIAAGNVIAEQSPVGTLDLSTWYRVELVVDTLGGLGQMRVYRDDSTVPVWDSGRVSANFGGPYNRVYIGRPVETSPTVGVMFFDDILITDQSWKWPGAVDPYTPPPGRDLLTWAGSTGTPWGSTEGTVTTSPNGIRMVPSSDGRANVRWAPASPEPVGFSLRFYAKYEGGAWADQPIKFFSVAAPGGVFPWRVELAGPLQGVPGQLRILDASGEVLASSGTRAMPLGDWRRVESRWDAGGVLVQVFDRFDQLAFDLSTPLALADYTALVIGHWTANPTPPPLSVNQIIWNTDPGGHPHGHVPGIIPTPVDVEGRHVWDGTTLIPIQSVHVWDGTSLVPGTITVQ